MQNQRQFVRRSVPLQPSSLPTLLAAVRARDRQQVILATVGSPRLGWRPVYHPSSVVRRTDAREMRAEMRGARLTRVTLSWSLATSTGEYCRLKTTGPWARAGWWSQRRWTVRQFVLYGRWSNLRQEKQTLDKLKTLSEARLEEGRLERRGTHFASASFTAKTGSCLAGAESKGSCWTGVQEPASTHADPSPLVPQGRVRPDTAPSSCIEPSR
jgi:hypothetical protein